MKKYSSAVVLILAFLATGCKESKEEMFGRIAREMTAKCPRAISEFTRLDSVVYLPGGNVNRYYYTLTGDADDVLSIETNREEMKAALTGEVANSMELKEYKEYNVTFEYIYYSDKDKTVLFRQKITPAAYK